jgi:primosomal protein N' (replication factor Y) (superfamily II helicase)
MNIKVVLKQSTLQFDKEYIYSVPPTLLSENLLGAKVLVPFGKSDKSEEAFVVSVMNDENSPFYVKPILSIEQPNPVLFDDQLNLVKEMCRKYSCTHGDAIKLMVPTLSFPQEKTNKTAYLNDSFLSEMMLNEGEITHVNQIRVMEYLLEYGESLISDILGACQITSSTLTTLYRKKIINFSERAYDEVNQDYESLQLPLEEKLIANSEQKDSIEKILGNLKGEYREYLLHGITGSGKTEVYFQVINELHQQGFGVILLVPEISLTPQMVSRMNKRFGKDVRVIHSRLNQRERTEQWNDIRSGTANIVVGARCAVFSPVHNLGAIIIDEEQETTYKSQTHPKYNALDIARIRMRHVNGLFIMGSATPNVETYYRCKTGRTILLSLRKRICESQLPTVEIIDLREELVAGNRSIFSRALREKMQEAFIKDEQVLLFINRRGYSGFLLCRDCGYVPKCQHCSVSLTYHMTHKSLICHYCGKIYTLPRKCPICQNHRITGFGAGTQQIEQLSKMEFPNARILRMDQDTTTGKGSHEKILSAFEKGEANLLIGTQMIAKGHDFPNVTLVGILSADLMLGLPDFRASERTFQLITQAAGRAGRSIKPGHVVIQAYNVDDYSILYASRQDYEGFFDQEIAYRQSMGYPPFKSIGLIMVSSDTEDSALIAARRIRTELEGSLKDPMSSSLSSENLEIMDISKAPTHMIRNRYRYRIILKATNEIILASCFVIAQTVAREKKVMVSFDTNPYQMN